jgi:large subunit ribosomal protein L10e
MRVSVSMARLRKFSAYQNLKRPYTRFSKFKKHNFVRARPVCRVVKFEMGDINKKYDFKVHLISKEAMNVRDNALESARQTSNRHLEKVIGKNQYYFQTRIYPHHVLRENPLASGAGADRMSTGMAKAFGKPIGVAARIKEGQQLFTVMLRKQNLASGRVALKKASKKLPCGCAIIVEKVPVEA